MIRNLSYVGFTSPAASEWRTFGPDVLGMQLATDRSDDVVRLRVDRAAWRVAIHPGDLNDLAYLGWDVGDAKGLDAVVRDLAEAGITAVADDQLARIRQVAAAAWFTDPFGFRHELTFGLADGHQLAPGGPSSGFVTGEQGLGHIVLIVPDLAAAEDLFTNTLGMRLSDTIEFGATLRFFHCAGASARHHTLALAGAPGLVGVHHLMLEVGSLDDVGLALDRVSERGIPVAMGLGHHPNDLMTSFYVRTPSGFEIEYGTGGVLIDDASWQPDASYDAISVWGHRPPATGPLPPEILRPYARTSPG